MEYNCTSIFSWERFCFIAAVRKQIYLNFAAFCKASLATPLLTLWTSKRDFQIHFFGRIHSRCYIFCINRLTYVRCLELLARNAEATLCFLLHRIEAAWNADGNTLSYENIPSFICSNCHFLPLAFIFTQWFCHFFLTIFTYLSLHKCKYFDMFCRKVTSRLVKYRHYLFETDNVPCLKNITLLFQTELSPRKYC